MKITEALKILNLSDKEARPFDVLLVCGFTPLHLQTLLAAHLQLRQPDRSVRLATGQFGNLAQTLEGAEDSGPTNIAVVLEWSDIDSRLGYRAAATWDSTTLDDIQSAARDAFDRVQHAIERIRQKATVVVCPPTLPLPPVVTGAGWETGPAELALARVLADFNAAIAEMGVSVVNPSRLAEESPVGQRRDLKSDLYAGFPYSLSHADAMASALSSLLFPPAFKKGLITDLDDTLWSGLAGEVGPDGVHWDLERRSHVHALYQMLLASLADSGALLAVASKNDPRVVDAVFEREDLLVQKEQMFPIEVHWQPKSASVGRILRTWNVSADAVVFVDDSALELAEVAEAHPGVQCLQFSAKDHGSVYSTLRRIRDLFGRPHSSA